MHECEQDREAQEGEEHRDPRLINATSPSERPRHPRVQRDYQLRCGLERNRSAIGTAVVSRRTPVSRYLFHVGSASTDVLALPAIVDGLIAGGYRFATIDELVAD